MTMVPKPNKPVSIANIRPISLTPCAGKFFELMVNKRLTIHLEENSLYLTQCSASAKCSPHKTSSYR
ncbi:hypothetical protein HPB52_001669 [Rhipicephalus sanguineus]|uniref:Uncharacterized protein n=1 Tax=Rhipicephalus sanguineus TaxID=34632 RepID=A0A9D4SXA4_RHISA|nr:hypothetical protein HPB52_001669 [Rhipicephalus sanguineus]